MFRQGSGVPRRTRPGLRLQQTPLQTMSATDQQPRPRTEVAPFRRWRTDHLS